MAIEGVSWEHLRLQSRKIGLTMNYTSNSHVQKCTAISVRNVNKRIAV